jgi:hypothetical protein
MDGSATTAGEIGAASRRAGVAADLFANDRLRTLSDANVNTGDSVFRNS